MSEPSALIRALFDRSVHDDVELTIEDARRFDAVVSAEPSYLPFDPTGTRTRGSTRLKCTATRETYAEHALPSAELVVEAVERRVWDEPTLNVYDPATKPTRENADRIVESRWRVLGELIGIEVRNEE
jgi:hypothetical protein